MTKNVLIALLFACSPLTAMDFLPYAGGYETVEQPERSYEVGIDQSQIDDLQFALHALAYQSFSEILANRVQLQEALMRVDEVHPLHFISAVFQDEELTQCMHLIREKQWLWRHFNVRVKRTLDAEQERANMSACYVQEFADHLNVDFATIMDMVTQSDWDALMNHLFEKFPKSED